MVEKLAQDLEQDPATLLEDKAHFLTLIEDKFAPHYAEKGLALPTSLEDLAQADYAGLTVVENPALLPGIFCSGGQTGLRGPVRSPDR